jgi:hypothetical protein
VVGVFDEASEGLIASYAWVLDNLCAARPDSTLIANARAYLRAVRWTFADMVPDAAVEVSRRGGLTKVAFDGGDLWASVYFDAAGEMVFADQAGIMRDGTQLWPSDPLPPPVTDESSELAPPPLRVDTWSTAVPPEAILERFRGLRVVRAMADQPWSLVTWPVAYSGPWLPGRWILVGLRPGPCREG